MHLAHKYDSNSSANDRVLVFNQDTQSFEGDWLFPASHFTVWDDKPAFGTSNGSNVMKMYDGEADTWDGTDYSISTEVSSNWINVTPSGMEDQSVTGLHVAGFIRGDSQAFVYLYADHSDIPVLTVDFSGSESDFTYALNVAGALGELPLGQNPLGSVDEADEDGLRRFRFTVWFPDIYANVIGWGWKSSGKNEYIEINQLGVSVTADVLSVGPGLVKST